MSQARDRVQLSYSSISTYETCPAKWRFQYEERLPTGPSPALSFGDSIHRALRRFHDRPVPVAPSLEELLEARELVEVPAARLAARRRSEADLERLRASVPQEPLRFPANEQFAWNKEFHTIVAEGCANKLLYITLQPVFSVLQRNLARSSLGVGFHRSINEHHRRIAEAIEAGDPDAAGAEMHGHLEFLRPAYEKAWKKALASRRPA